MTVRQALCLFVVLLVAPVAGCGGDFAAEGLDEQLARGWRAFSTGDFDIALSLFHQVESAEDAGVPEKYSALLGIASTHHLRTNPELGKARAYYGRLTLLEHDAARRQGLLGLGLVEVAAGNVAEGQTHLAKLMKDYSDSIEADEATIHTARSLFAATLNEDQPGVFELPRPTAVQRG
ncbi:MAG: tetratricopeptide repeat protein, partial [Planctomycetota bacterium]